MTLRLPPASLRSSNYVFSCSLPSGPLTPAHSMPNAHLWGWILQKEKASGFGFCSEGSTSAGGDYACSFMSLFRGESTSPRRVRVGLSSLLHLWKLKPTCSSSQNEKCTKCQRRLDLAFLHLKPSHSWQSLPVFTGIANIHVLLIPSRGQASWIPVSVPDVHVRHIG